MFESFYPQDGSIFARFGGGRWWGRSEGEDSLGSIFFGWGFGGILQAIDHSGDGDLPMPQPGQHLLHIHIVEPVGHLEHAVRFDQGIQTRFAQFPLQKLPSSEDILISMGTFEPLSDAITGRMSGNKIDPIEAGMSVLLGNDLDDIACL